MINPGHIRYIVLSIFGLLMFASSALAMNAQHLVPWLDVPATWQRNVENNVVTLIPDTLPAGRSFLMLVEPSQHSTTTLETAYDQAINDLGPWRAVGQVVEDHKPNSWSYRFGVGVATLNNQNFTGLTVVAQYKKQRVRMWVLADSDDTYNRYQNEIGSALASIQDINTAQANFSAIPATNTFKSAKPDTNFGKGISGVYVGIERGLSASASVGSGPQQVFNQSTGNFETSNTGTSQQISTQIGDYSEVDVFYPDGTYRRRMPVRGMASDFNWERQQQEIMWGTWKRDGKIIIVQRGNYTTSYTIENDNILISDRGRPWYKLPLPNNTRLEGVYARDDYRDASAPRLVLHANGTYEDRGDFLRMIGSAWNLVNPDGDTMIKRWSDAEARRAMSGGSGNYTFNQFTLSLHDRDGRVWQLNTYVPPGENAARPIRLVINGRALLRD